MPPPEKVVRELVINGCECEPYLTRDFRLMMERTEDLLEGTRLICRALGISRATIGIENNKPAAIKALQEAVDALNPARSNGADWPEIVILPLRVKYPQGAEKMLIKAVTGREVPPGGLPMDAEVAIQNIGTVLAMRDAVLLGLPQTTAALTVTGRGVKEPKNLLVHVGTPVSEVLDFCGGLTEDAARVVIGGPMMGVAQHDLNAPVVKATSGILVLTEADIAEPVTTACLSCGKCVSVCPLNLLPSRLARLSELDRFEEAKDLGLETCMECGSCSYTCPAHIPLVQWFRMGKQGIRKLVL
jgi:electron transport complex protein RnfC